MTTPYQTGLFGAPQPTADGLSKTPIPRTTLLAFAERCEANGEKHKASAIRTACQHVWGDDPVLVSNALVRLWGMEDTA